jgi:succinate dehydrogenase/fumarate reductase flavoprotein subunit
MASNIFLKGYQWPFSAARSEAFGSSLIDIAVDAEIRAGRKVYLDFNENPSMNGEALEISKLIPEARQYLEKSGAIQATPYERLAWMNPASIEIYTENRIDLREPLEIAVSFQHNNGGIDVDYTYLTSIASLFAIGEIAGAHGVSRPGGAALNSGQVGGIRVVQYLKSKGVPLLSGQKELIKDAAWVFAQSRKMLSGDTHDHFSIRKEIQQRMTDTAGFIRDPKRLSVAFKEAEVLMKSADNIGVSFPEQVFLSDAWDTRNLAITHAAFLKSIEYYINNGGGSRGSYLVIDDSDGKNTAKIESASGPLLSYRKESMEHRKQRINTSGQDLSIRIDEVRAIPEDESWYETTWAEYRDGKLF